MSFINSFDEIFEENIAGGTKVIPKFSGNALKEVGEAFSQLAEIKDSLDVGVKQDFLDPLQQLCDKDIKEVMVSMGPRMR